MKSSENTGTAGTAKPTLLFVVGLWRSGTSLLQALLQRHPQVALMYEAEPFALWPRDARAIWPSNWPQRLECYNQTFSRHHLDAALLPAPASAREAALALYRAFAALRGATIFGEKAPAYHPFLPGIARVFPEARFLIIWRDPLECCRSAARAGRKNRFFAQRGIMARMLFGAEALARGVEELQRQRVAVHEVVYPEFVAAPETHLRSICDFLQIPFDARMLDLKGADLSVLPQGEHHEQVRSGQIRPTAGNEDPLTPAFTARVRSYAVLWRGQFAHLGFCRALDAESVQDPTGRVRQRLDRGVNLAWRCLDAFKRSVFRRIPLIWWRALRPGPSNTANGEANRNHPAEASKPDASR